MENDTGKEIGAFKRCNCFFIFFLIDNEYFIVKMKS